MTAADRAVSLDYLDKVGLSGEKEGNVLLACYMQAAGIRVTCGRWCEAKQ